MDQLKVIRTVCLFTAHPSEHTLAQLEHLCRALAARGFIIQTHRLCSPDRNGVFALDRRTATPVFFSLGSQTFDAAQEFLAEFVAANNVHCNVDLTREQIDNRHVSLLTTLMRERPSKTFNFAYTFNPVASTPYFPSATYVTDGFAVGLQPTDLSDGCQTLQAWLDRLKAVWMELNRICSAEAGFLGIDPSIAPLGAGRGSLLHFLKRLGQDFSRSVTTDVYLRITRFLTEAAPKKVGLCGIMFACLEDFELAAEYEQIVKDWIATAKHPKTGKLFTEMVYQPMLELLAYLRANGFKNFIVSGGGIEFMRPWAEKTYGIPPEQVVGSSIKTKFEMRDGKPVLVRLPELNFNDDKADKPVGISQHIGRRPIAAFGNSRGDQEMLEYTQGGSGARFELLVLHDDAAREYAYGPAQGLPDVKLGAFTQAVYDEAQKAGWTVVSMKDDWKQVFPVGQSPVTAIDILLEPDATMLQHSEANNARLLAVFPKGFALDATHRPHITMIQRFVRTADLDKVYAAADKVLASANVNAMKLEAFKYYYIPTKELGLAGIVAKPTPELLKLQADLIAAVAPFTGETGDSSAFVTTLEDPIIDPALIGYVAAFVPKGSGEHFNPHVTTGVAPREYLDPMLAEPFEPFTFSPAGAAVYQLGQFGTAAKKLKEWDLQP